MVSHDVGTLANLSCEAAQSRICRHSLQSEAVYKPSNSSVPMLPNRIGSPKEYIKVSSVIALSEYDQELVEQ